MAVVVVDEGQLGVIVLAAPLDGLGGAASRRTSGALAWQAEREDAVAGANEHLHPSKIFKIENPQLKIQNPIRGVGGGDVTGGAEYLAHVLGEVKAVCVPAAAPPALKIKNRIGHSLLFLGGKLFYQM